jgi:predicted SprT family Zn-dependent metalloprotease
MLTTAEVKRIVAKVVDDIAAQYPTLVPPELEFDTHHSGAYSWMSNKVEVNPKMWVSPVLAPEDIEAVVAHEMGHWHHWQSDPMDALKMNFQRPRDVSVEDYRQLPREKRADEFAKQHLKRDIDLAELNHRFHFARALQQLQLVA